MEVYGGGHRKHEKRLQEVQEHCSRALQGRSKSPAQSVTALLVSVRISPGHHGKEEGGGGLTC